MGLEVAAIVTTGGDALDALREHQPDLVLIDVGLPDESGIAVGAKLIAERPETRVVALTALADPELVREALHVGFSGYLTKDTQADLFARAVQGVIDGQIVVPQRLGKDALEPVPVMALEPEESAVGLLARQLTPRELEVLEMLAQGAGGGEIARRLGVSPNTVRTHVQGILSKLQVHSRLEAAAFAVRHQLVKSGPSAR
jgi:two-component system, NarL family, nitrate/nitrite response regulator NarL